MLKHRPALTTSNSFTESHVMAETNSTKCPTRIADLSGTRFGRLVVVAFSHQTAVRPRRAFWLCVCDCGGSGVFSGPELKRGNTRSCGCLKRDRFAGECNPKWNGGRKPHSRGYVMIRLNNTYVLEHRHVMEMHLGRALADDEVVHHKNGDKSDNRLENLEILTPSEHMSLHATLTRWSRRHLCCIQCGTTSIKHHSRGLCSCCYYRERDHRRKL